MTETDTKSKRQLQKISHEKAKSQAHTKTQTGVDKNVKCMAEAEIGVGHKKKTTVMQNL